MLVLGNGVFSISGSAANAEWTVFFGTGTCIAAPGMDMPSGNLL
jgi:hypothetical protein